VLLTGHRARRGRYDAPQRPFADDNGTIGQVRIRNTLTSASSFIAAVIDRLSRRHPRIVFDVVPAVTGAVNPRIDGEAGAGEDKGAVEALDCLTA